MYERTHVPSSSKDSSLFIVFKVNDSTLYAMLLRLMLMSGHVDKLTTVNERSLFVIRFVTRVDMTVPLFVYWPR